MRIGRLALELPGFVAADAGRLAEKIAAHLGRAGALGEVVIPRLEIVLDTPDTDLDQLAARIAGAIRHGG